MRSNKNADLRLYEPIITCSDGYCSRLGLKNARLQLLPVVPPVLADSLKEFYSSGDLFSL
jgi:hypothetical protein